jgi:hypothetical protein
MLCSEGFYRHLSIYFCQKGRGLCEECEAEHTGLVRENVPDLQPQGDEYVHPWRYTEDDGDNGTLPY